MRFNRLINSCGILVALCVAGCDTKTLDVEVDVMPGVYPNQLTDTQSTVEVALLAPEGFTIRSLGDVQIEASSSSSFESNAPTVTALGKPKLQDVNGDGRPDLVATFSVAALRSAGVLGIDTSRLSVRATVPKLGSCIGSDRLFDVTRPIVKLPVPRGSESVGTSSFMLFDSSRAAVTAAANATTAADATTKGRTLVVRLWYPATPSLEQPTTYFLDDREAEANVPADAGLPPTLFDGIFAWSVLDAQPTRQAKRPTLMLSTGFGVPLTLYSGLAEELASYGYVIVGLEHPDGSGTVVYPDGSSSPAPTNLPDTELVHSWSRDIEFTLKSLPTAARQIAMSAEAKRAIALIDYRRIGALGHSLGGAAAVWAAAETPMLRASANLDGSLWGDVLSAGPRTPTMLMLAENHPETDPTIGQFLESAKGTVYQAVVAGSTHMNFSDFGFLIGGLSAMDPSITPEDNGLGTIDNARSLVVQSAYLRAFFGAALSAQPSDLLVDNVTEFPEVSLSVQPSMQ